MSSPSQSVLGIISQDLRMLELRSNDETSNVGTKWTIEEDNRLVEEIIENKTYEEIALEHKRTVHGIKLRVISHIIYPKIKDATADMEALALEYIIMLDNKINEINSKLDNLEYLR